MKLTTNVEIPSLERPIGLHNRLAFIGSCFAEYIGTKMRQSGLTALVNPFGVQYNPLSILQVLTQDPTCKSLYFEDEDQRWHCWLLDSHFSATSLEACKSAFLSARGRLMSWNPDTLVLTLGTNRYYERADSKLIVGNCHKRPQAEFVEKEMSLTQCIATLETICQLFQRSRIILTLSPFRYAKYGFHENQLAKATLLMAIDAVQKKYPEQVCYFPAYEILLDELRDYRFYGPDMLHPSEQAVDYIWERFSGRWFDDETHRYLMDYEPIRKALQHRPDEPDSSAARRFREQTLDRQNALMAKYHLEP
ncbi:MAG: GSCFA domain-containing protein [Bacteroidaceae bacterium]|nr:GSCFA domain-containing protein [Bacteroidaceae bacterium]